MAKKVTTSVPQVDPEIQKIAKALYDRTLKQVGKYFGEAQPKPDAPVVPTKLKPIVDAVNGGDWGCQHDSVVKLVSALTGADITPYLTEEDDDSSCIDSDDLLIGVLLVPTRSDNNHSYPLERPCMVTSYQSDENLMEARGDINCDQIDLDIACLRLPTFEEVVTFVTTSKDNVLQYVFFA